MKILSLITHPHCRFKPVRPSFGTQIYKDIITIAGPCVSSTTRIRRGIGKRISKTDTEEKKLLNKVVIFVFIVHKKYSRSFIKLQLNNLCHMDNFNDVLISFLGLERVSCVAVSAGSESSRISSKTSSFVFQR